MSGAIGQSLVEDDGDGGSWDTSAMGAITQGNLGSADAQRLNMLQNMSEKLYQDRQSRAANRNGGVNLPLLSAAGAFLAPTKGGGFGESISNAVGQAVPLALQERKLDADEDRTSEQQYWNRIYQTELLKDRAEGRKIQGTRAEDLKEHQRRQDEAAAARATAAVTRANAGSDKGRYKAAGFGTDGSVLLLDTNTGTIVTSDKVAGPSPNAKLGAETKVTTTGMNNNTRLTTTREANQTRGSIEEARRALARETTAATIGSREKIAADANASREGMAQATITSREGIAGANNQFRYKKLDSDSELRGREIQLQMEGRNAAEARHQARLEFDQQKQEQQNAIQTRANELRARGLDEQLAFNKARTEHMERQSNTADATNDFRYTKLDNDREVKDRALTLQEQGKSALDAQRQARLEFDRQKLQLQSAIQMRSIELRAEGMTEAQATARARTEIMKQNADTAAKRLDITKEPLIQFDKPVVAQATDADGNPALVLAQQHRQSGQWVTADEKRAPISGVTGLVKAGETPLNNDPNVDRVAKMIAQYKLPPLSGFVLKTPFGQAVLAKIGDINPEYTSTEFGARNKAFRDFATGTQGNVSRFINVGISHIGTMRELIDALDNGNIPMVNRVANEFARQTGQTAPTSFDAAKQVVGQEIVKSVVGAGAGTGEERKSAADKLLAANSPQQLHEALNTYVELLKGQLSGLKQQYERTTRLKNFDDEFLSPEVHREIERSTKRREGPSAGKPAETFTPAPIMTKGEYDAAKSGARYRLPSDEPTKFRVKP